MIVTAVAVGTRGDVEPLVHLGQEMVRRGHEFRICTHESFRPMVERYGIAYHRLSSDADHLMRYLVTDYKTSLDFARGMLKLKRENPAFMDEALCAMRGSDLVMYGTCGAFARHAAESLGIPCARYFFSPMDPTRQYSLYSNEFDSDRVLKSYDGLPQGMSMLTKVALNGWRRKAGLAPWHLGDTYTKLNGRDVLTFYPTSRALMSPDPSWGSHIHVTGYWYHPTEHEGQALLPDVENFLAQGEPPVFVAFGKATSPDLAELQVRTLQALRATGIRALVQADQIPAGERVNTGGIHFVGPVPYASVFGRCRAVMHHGGNTTNGLGLRAGLPTLVVALALDQHFYGRMDHHLGAGPAPLYIRKRLCTQDDIARSLQDLVSGSYDQGAARVAEQIRSEKGVEEAADAIEAYV